MAIAAPPKPPPNNIANQLTLSRLALGVVLFVLIGFHQWVWCLVVFALASVTDWLDGYYARKYNLVSALGRMLDPLVDKIVVCGAFILLLNVNPYHIAGYAGTGLVDWMVVVIVAREFLVTGVRSLMEQEGIPFGADLWGKLKMILQCTVLLTIFLCFSLQSLVHGQSGAMTSEDFAILFSMDMISIAGNAILWAMLVITAGSGLNYCWKAARMIKA